MKPFSLVLLSCLSPLAAFAAEGAAQFKDTEGKGPQMQQLVDDAIKTGKGVLELPEGRVELDKPLVISGAKSLLLKGRPGSTVLVNRHGGSTISVSGSDSVSFQGFAIDSDPLPFTQGGISKVSAGPAGASVEFSIHKGYPAMTPELLARRGGLFYFFDGAARHIKDGTKWAPLSAIQMLDGERGVVKADAKTPLKPGDMILLRPSLGTVFELKSSGSIRIEDVKIYSGGAALVARYMRDAESFFRYSIERGPKPAGATEERLISSCADGFNWGFGKGSVTLDGCDFGYMGDDGVNIHGVSYPVVETVSDSEFWIASPWQDFFSLAPLMKEGEALSFFSQRDPTAFGEESPIKSLVPAPERKGPVPEAACQGGRYNHYFNKERPAYYAKVVLAKPAPRPPQVGDIAIFKALSSVKFSIRNSKFHDNRGRGILIYCGSGAIEGNVVERTALPGISLWNEMTKSFGGAGCENVRISGNAVRASMGCSALLLPDSEKCAALMLSYEHKKADLEKGRPPLYHRNIVISGNSIDGSGAGALLVNAARNVDVSGNVIDGCNLLGGSEASSLSGPAQFAVTLMDSEGVKLEGNKVGGLGPFCKGAQGILSSVKNGGAVAGGN